MTAIALPELDESVFSAESYRTMRVPTVDGKRAERIALRFSGAVERDRTASDDLEFVDGLTLDGSLVRLVIVGEAMAKSFIRRKGREVAIDYAVSLRVESVEIGELA
jgi:hypothetical protein